MKIIFAGATLCDSSAGLWFSALRVDGRGVVDVQQTIFGAACAVFFRDNKSHDITFTVKREFDTLREAQVAALTAYSYAAGSGTLEFQCGEAGETSQSAYAPQAAFASLSPRLEGVAVFFDYTFTVGTLSTSVPPSFVLGGEDVTQAFVLNISSGSESVVVAFSPSFPGAGAVVIQSCLVECPSGQPKIGAVPTGVSTAGFTALLDAQVPATGYKLHVSAIQKS